MNNQINLQEIHKIIDNFSTTLVGILSKRIEVLEKLSDDKNSPILIKSYPIIFKKLARELVYENSRILKQRITASTIPTVVYKGK